VSVKNINRATLQRCMSPTAHSCSHTLRSQEAHLSLIIYRLT